jgi:hypothetical protein
MRRATGIGVAIGLTLLLITTSAIAQAVTGSTSLTPDDVYVGGRGLITAELATGMFINPTSGILNHGQFTLQYCARIFHTSGPEKDTVVSHGAIAAFGLLDLFEVGVAGLLRDLPGPLDNQMVGGPTVKVRLLKDQGPLPEIGIGAILLFGDTGLERQTVYIAVSKGLTLSDGRFFRSIRGHVGFRQTWFEEGDDGSFGFVGLEVEVVRYTYLVAEVSNKSAGFEHIPWAAGLQLRHPAGFGFTLAAAQYGNQANPGIYVGVGINFQ